MRKNTGRAVRPRGESEPRWEMKPGRLACKWLTEPVQRQQLLASCSRWKPAFPTCQVLAGMLA